MFTGAVAKLSIQTGVLNAIADTATLSLAGGGTAAFADDGFVDLGGGVNEIIRGLVLGGVSQPVGTYGGSLSPAQFKNDEYFGGSGIVTVVPEPASAAILLVGASAALGFRRFWRSGVL
jgi:hypothetical protein